MNNIIFKYQIPIQLTSTIHLPKNAEILYVGTQQGSMCIWCLIDEKVGLEPRQFYLFGTGQQIERILGYRYVYIGTFKLDNDTLILHLFESVPV